MKNAMATISLLLASAIMGSVGFAAGGTSGSRPAGSAVTLNFISLGAGIDGEKFVEATAIIGKYMQRGQVAEFKQSNWGREGETTICVKPMDEESFLQVADELDDLKSPIVAVAYTPGC